MKPKFITELQDPFDSFFNAAVDEVYPRLWSSTENVGFSSVDKVGLTAAENAGDANPGAPAAVNPTQSFGVPGPLSTAIAKVAPSATTGLVAPFTLIEGAGGGICAVTVNVAEPSNSTVIPIA